MTACREPVERVSTHRDRDRTDKELRPEPRPELEEIQKKNLNLDQSRKFALVINVAKGLWREEAPRIKRQRSSVPVMNSRAAGTMACPSRIVGKGSSVQIAHLILSKAQAFFRGGGVDKLATPAPTGPGGFCTRLQFKC